MIIEIGDHETELVKRACLEAARKEFSRAVRLADRGSRAMVEHHIKESLSLLDVATGIVEKWESESAHGVTTF